MEASTVPTAASRPMKSSEKAVEKHGVPVIENPITGRPNNPTGASMSAMLLAAGAYGSNGTAKRTILRVPSKEAQTPNRRGRLPRIPSNEDSAPSSDSGPGRSLSPITPSRQDGYKHSPLKREGLDTSGASLSSRTTEDTNDGSPAKFGVPSAPLKSPVVTHNSVSTYGAAAGGGVGGGGRDRAADSDAATAVSLDKTIRRIVALESSRLSLSEQVIVRDGPVIFPLFHRFGSWRRTTAVSLSWR